jgi:hypothetical protein
MLNFFRKYEIQIVLYFIGISFVGIIVMLDLVGIINLK